MNNKDREALDKFVDEDYLSPEDTKLFAEMLDGERATFIAERFFEAGAKHGRSQLNELRDDNMSELYNVIKKLQEENKKLVNTLKLFAFPEGKLEHEDVERVSRKVLKEIGEE